MTGKFLQAVLGLLLCGSLTSVAAGTDTDEPKVLVLKFADTTTADFMLADKPEITFGEGKLTVTSAAATVEYDQDAVSEYYFSATPTSVGKHVADGFSFRYTDNAHVVISGTTSAKVSLFDTSGKLLQSQAVTGGAVTVSVESLPAGIYILNLENEHSFKIIKK